MLDIVFPEDIPLDIGVFMSRVDVLKIRWVESVNELEKAIYLRELILLDIRAN